MAAVNKTVREVFELPAKDAKKAKTLLTERKEIKVAEDALDKKKAENSASLLELLNKLDIESVFDSDIGTATMATRKTTSIKEDLLSGALRAVGLTEKKIKAVLEASKVTTESKPYITFKTATKNK